MKKYYYYITFRTSILTGTAQVVLEEKINSWHMIEEVRRYISEITEYEFESIIILNYKLLRVTRIKQKVNK